MPYVIFNGNLHKSEAPLLKADNRAFQYGDGLFESMLYTDGKILFLQEHLQRLYEGMTILHLQFSETNNILFLEKTIGTLLEANHISGDARIRLTVFRKKGGHYQPLSTMAEYLLEAEPIANGSFPFVPKGVHIGIYTANDKSCSPLSNFKTIGGSLLSVLAAAYAKQQGWDDCLLINHKGNIIEAHNANLFIVKNDGLITPPLSEGCVNGIMRKQVVRAANVLSLSLQESPLTIDELMQADEIFLTNSVRGIRWVERLREREYHGIVVKRLAEQVNKLIFSGQD